MEENMNKEIMYLVCLIILHCVMWIPYIINFIMKNGLICAMGVDASYDKMDNWAKRMKKAHYNGVENLVLFAPLVILIDYNEGTSSATACLCLTYLCARFVHYIGHTFAIKYVRTLSFIVGNVCCLALAIQLLRALI
jgi:uncharacterized MAPEG superfamily protein